LYNYQEVIDAGKSSTEPFRKCTGDDYPIFSYTSGTTGDSKGVKLTHKNLLSSAQSIMKVWDFTREDTLISYLPYPHSFEQVMTATMCIAGCRIGYY
jgi:malonyl-CoA/methylmalonyl-CoA synthetase